MPYNLITILGPTAAGKTRLAAKLADYFNGEIISADSRQVYRGMDIGTGKDFDDYSVNGNYIEYHLIDILNPEEEFNLYLFRKYFLEAFNIIKGKNKVPFLAGGTGLYLSSILQKYDLKKADFDSPRSSELHSLELDDLKEILRGLNPKLHNTTDLLDKERIIIAILISESEGGREDLKSNIEINSFNIGVLPSRDEIKKRITERLKLRLQNGMIEEVKALLEKDISYEKLDFFGLEYRYISRYLKGELNYNDMFQKLNSSIHGFAKRQVTWFRKMEREGVKINWIDHADFISAKELINNGFKK